MAGRIPTAYRVPSRQGTAMRGGTGFKGEAPNTSYQDVKVVNRPVTQHGLTGIKTASQGPGRIVYDKSYYLGILRQKNTELREEVDNFDREMDEISRSSNMFRNLEKQKDSLIKEVRNLEGELADYNLTLDKQRAETQAEEVLSTYEYMKSQNQRQREQLDSLFLERKNIEDEIARAEMEIQSINSRAEERLNELDADERQEYIQLQNENRSLEDEIQNKKAILDNVNQRLAAADSRLRTDVLKQKAHHLREQRQNLVRRKEDLEVQTNELNLSFPEARERLLARVKADNTVIKDTENRAKEVEKAISSYKKQIEEMDNDLKNSDDNQMEKYEILAQRDKAMTDFIDSFESTKKGELDMIKNLEDNISQMLEQIATILDRKENLPDQSQVKDWKSEYTYKKEQTTNAAVTMERLKKELEERQSDLEKVKSLDERLPQQLKAVKDKIKTMEDEIQNKYNNVDTMRVSAQQELRQLNQEKENLQQKKEKLSQEIRSSNLKYESKKRQLEDSSVYKELKDQEQKMTLNEQTLYGLKSYIDSKGAETNYQAIMQDCYNLVHDINSFLLSRYN